MSSSPRWRSAWVVTSQALSSDAPGCSRAEPSASRSAPMPSSSARVRLSASPSVYSARVAPGGRLTSRRLERAGAEAEGKPGRHGQHLGGAARQREHGGRVPGAGDHARAGRGVDHGADTGGVRRGGHARRPARPAWPAPHRAARPVRPAGAWPCAAAPSRPPPPGHAPSRPRRPAPPGRRAAPRCRASPRPPCWRPPAGSGARPPCPAGPAARRGAGPAAARTRCAAPGGTGGRCRCRPPPGRRVRPPRRCPRARSPGSAAPARTSRTRAPPPGPPGARTGTMRSWTRDPGRRGGGRPARRSPRPGGRTGPGCACAWPGSWVSHRRRPAPHRGAARCR